MSVITNTSIQPSSGQAFTIKDEGGTASITVQTDGDLTLAENAYLGSGKGIYFDGQTTSANFLDDYEEGTFLPTLIGLGGGEAGYATNGQAGTYTKIGRVVNVNFYIKISSNSGPSGQICVANFPFIVADTISHTSLECSGSIGYFGNMSSATSGLWSVGQQSQSRVLLYFVDGTTDTTITALTTSAIDSSFEIRGSITYFTS